MLGLGGRESLRRYGGAHALAGSVRECPVGFVRLTTFAFVRVGVSVRFIPVSVGQWCGTFAR